MGPSTLNRNSFSSPSFRQTWQLSDMLGVSREVIEHHLAVFPDVRPIRQKVRRQALERQDVIRLEVDKLLRVGFIREVRHPD